MVDSGETKETVVGTQEIVRIENNASFFHEKLQVRKQMAGAHAMLLDELERVNDKYKAVRKLEKSMADLHQMFVDMNQLIHHQGELLDVIEVNVAKTKQHTAMAEKELIQARKHQWAAQKKKCCITCFGIVIVCVIILPVVLGGGGVR